MEPHLNTVLDKVGCYYIYEDNKEVIHLQCLSLGLALGGCVTNCGHRIVAFYVTIQGHTWLCECPLSDPLSLLLRFHEERLIEKASPTTKQ